MLVVPPLALPHLVAAVRDELARQDALRLRSETDDEWPEDYDGNDGPLFEMAADALAAAQIKASLLVDLTGKAAWFLMGLLPGYARANLGELSDEEYEALRNVYQQMPVTYAGPFPER